GGRLKDEAGNLIPPRRATEAEARQWWGNGEGYGVGLVQGAISGNAETLDFDHNAEKGYPAWCEIVHGACPDLLYRLSHGARPGDGNHVTCRCLEVQIPGNTTLARTEVEALDGNEIEIGGKKYKPRKRGERWVVVLTLIETRGEGGQIVAPGSPGH